LRSASRASDWAARASFLAASLAARSWAERERVERLAVTASGGGVRWDCLGVSGWGRGVVIKMGVERDELMIVGVSGYADTDADADAVYNCIRWEGWSSPSEYNLVQRSGCFASSHSSHFFAVPPNSQY
jgi:hypothetical protein